MRVGGPRGGVLPGNASAAARRQEASLPCTPNVGYFGATSLSPSIDADGLAWPGLDELQSSGTASRGIATGTNISERGGRYEKHAGTGMDLGAERASHTRSPRAAVPWLRRCARLY